MIPFPKPMLATEGGKPFTDPAWVYEIKFDGFRCMAQVDAGAVELRTKNLANCTRWYPEIVKVLAALPGGPHIIDGEAVVLDELGRPDFNAMLERSARRKWYPGARTVVLAAFDLLVHDGQDIMARPLSERKARLAGLLQGLQGVLFVRDLPAKEELFAEFVLPLKLEGFMAKRLDSPYLPGERTDAWVKVKRAGWQEGRNWKG